MKEPLPETYQGWPVVTAQRMREIDQSAIRDHGLKAIDLMENAGRAVAAETVVFLASAGRELRGSRIAVCCGRGANGGDGLVAARILKQGGAEVEVFMCEPKKEGRDPGVYPEPVAVNLDKAKALGIPVVPGADEAALALGLERAD
ncbi:MAG: NAD(P)H-hydrate epimerase, partial [Elusimicrobiota bacterium]